jgi:hypothetical protein
MRLHVRVSLAIELNPLKSLSARYLFSIREMILKKARLIDVSARSFVERVFNRTRFLLFGEFRYQD